MKTCSLFICGLFLSLVSLAQGSILGFTVEPQSPSEADFVKVYAGLSFTSGDCPLDDKDHFTNGLITDAYAHHCVGILTYICNTVDTFHLGYLTAGNHKFRLVLTSGAAPPPCTPGIAINDRDSTSFVVATTTGIGNYEMSNQELLIYPNPVSDKAKIVISDKISANETIIEFYDLFGRKVKSYSNFQGNEITFSRDDLERGIYFYRLINKKSVITKGKLVIE